MLQGGTGDMKTLLLGSVSAIALTCSVHAADLPIKAPAPPPLVVLSWAGPYIGIQGGVVSHRGEFYDANGLLDRDFTTPPTTYRADKTGGLFGGHAGYNWQSGSIVYGIEGDISGVWAKGSTRRPIEPTSFANFDVNWLATIRARFGVTVTPATLLYVTGGVAFGDVRNHAGVAQFNSNMIVDKVRTGWTVGGGVEHMFARNWTARAEVRYADLGSNSATCTPPGGDCGFAYRGEFSNKLLMGLVGASLKF
jgi:outer membrane immunogenic protein